jgi:hypothetical protein
LTDDAGRVGVTTTPKVFVAICVTGARSRTGSYGIFL